MKTNNKGFSHLETVLTVIVIGVITAVGLYVYNSGKNKSKAGTDPIVTELQSQVDSSGLAIGETPSETPEEVLNMPDPLDENGNPVSGASSPSIQGRRSDYKPIASVASRSVRSKILGVAKSQVGVAEQPLGSNDGATVNKYQRYAGSYCINQLWCASFTSWVYATATGTNKYRNCGISALRSQAQRAGKLHYGLRGLKPGDFVMHNSTKHIGIYYKGNRNSITTIDGNWSNRVTYHTDSWSYWNSYIDVD
jgi:hypothetical protein